MIGNEAKVNNYTEKKKQTKQTNVLLIKIVIIMVTMAMSG